MGDIWAFVGGLRLHDRRANMLHALSPAYAINLWHETMSPYGLTEGPRAIMPSSAMDAASKSQHDGLCALFFDTTLVRAFVALATQGAWKPLGKCVGLKIRGSR